MRIAANVSTSLSAGTLPTVSKGKILSFDHSHYKRGTPPNVFPDKGSRPIRAEGASLLAVESPPPESDPDTEPQPPVERLSRRQRRSLIRQAFGTKLLTTFAILFTLVTFVVFALAGWVIHDTTYSVLERQHGDHLKAVAAVAAIELNEPLALYSARTKEDEFHREARDILASLCKKLKEQAKVSQVVLFDGRGTDFVVLATSAEGPRGATHQAASVRLYADTLDIDRVRNTKEPVASDLYPIKLPDGQWHTYKSGYATVLDPDTGDISALVRVDIPVQFTQELKRVNWTFYTLGACAGLAVLLAAVFLVRQRVHLPVYRLVKAMQGGPGGAPQPARVRYNDEIGVLTERYNDMVDRMGEKDQKLRELYAQAEERATYLKGYSDHLVTGVPTGVLAVDPEGALTVSNPSAANFLGRKSIELGEPVAKVFGEEHPVARSLLRALRRSVTDQALIVLDAEGGARDSGWGGVDDPEAQRLVELSCAPFFGAGGELLGAVALVNDRTELERFRRVAIRNERLAAIGNLGAGLAHEIKNPLSAISGFAELIERKQGADAARLAGRLRGEVQELNTFLNEFLAFTRENRIRRGATDLNQLVTASLILALQGLGFGVDEQLDGQAFSLPKGGSLRIKLDLAADLPLLALDGTLLKAACRNLAENAIQIMDGKGGELAIRTHRIGEMVFVRFKDQGPGVPLEDRENIFNPLFTTRAEGTGLGLAIANKTVTAHNGKLSVRDAPGGGAEFVIRLPVVEAPAPEPAQPA